MAIDVTVRHMDASSSVQQYAREKAQALVELFPRTESVHVVLDVEKYRQLAEVVLQAKNHIRVEAQSESDDNMRAAIDQAMDKAETQMRKLRDKVQSHRVKRGQPEHTESEVGEQE